MKRFVQIALSLGLGAFLIWILFRHTDWQAVYASICTVNVWWLVMAQIFAWTSYFIRIQRWSYVVRASHPATYRSMFSATQIGFLVNFMIPARVGEMVRAYVLARLTKFPLSQSLAMVALDRVNDVFGLLMIVFVALLSFPSGRDIRFAPGTFGNVDALEVSGSLIRPVAASLTIFLFAVLAVLILLYANQSLVLRMIETCMRPISERMGQRLCKSFLNFAAGMHVFRSTAELIKSACFSVLTWGASIFSAAAIMCAFHIDFPWFAPFVMIAMIAVFISVPVTPGVVGQYHAAVVACLLSVMPDMDPAQAKAVAIVGHVLSLIPIAALGIFCVLRERLSVPDIVSHTP